MKDFKSRLINRELTIGSWITIGNLSVAEIMANAGFDWLTIDMEHSAITLSQAQELICIIELCGVTPLVRVGENNANLLKRVMDAGAHGVMVPLVNSKEDAEKAVAAVKYPPTGTRGVGLTRAQKYSLDLDRYKEWNKKNGIVIVQLEHIEAVENLEKIMSVEGINGFIIGLYDLSGSLNCPGDFNNPKVKQALEEIYLKSMKNNYLMGQHVVNPEPKQVMAKIDQGMKFIGVGTDFLFLNQHCTGCLKKIRDSLGSQV